jgi:RNA polymerase sigma factor (sigma-70 family)
LTEDGFASFFRESFSRIVIHLMTMGASRADTEDVTQEAMIEASRKWGAIETPDAWVRKVAGRGYWRAVCARKRSLPLDEGVQEPGSAFDLTIFVEEQQKVLSCFRALPLMQRTVAALFYDGWTCREIAELLEIPESTVRSHLRHARNKLKGMMLSAQLSSLDASPSWVSPMTVFEESEFVDLDTYVRAQLARAAESYASQIDMDAKLQAALRGGTTDKANDTPAET